MNSHLPPHCKHDLIVLSRNQLDHSIIFDARLDGRGSFVRLREALNMQLFLPSDNRADFRTLRERGKCSKKANSTATFNALIPRLAQKKGLLIGQQKRDLLAAQ
jgi:hypothetical protein